MRPENGHRSVDTAVEQEWYKKFNRIDGDQDLRPGVYRLVALDQPRASAPALIHRVCGDDATGTLYVGASDCLRNRISSLVATNRQDQYRHSPHKPLAPQLSALFPTNRLAFSWEFSEDPWGREIELLEAYLSEFGELPPHNRR